MLKIITLASLLAFGLASAQTAYGQQSARPQWSEQKRATIARQLGHRVNRNPLDCRSRCRPPHTTNDKIYCCVTCLGAEWICGVTGGCSCEVPFPN